jgi:hypothetical protein
MPHSTPLADQASTPPPQPGQHQQLTETRPDFLALPALPARRPLTTLQACALRSALESWKAYQNPPRMLNTVTLPMLIADYEASLIPADDAAYARALSKLIEFALAFGIPCGDPAAVQRIYREKLGDLPSDLLAKAVARVTDSWTWGNRLPMPAEIRKTISNELTYRKIQISRAKVALLKARDRVAPPPPLKQLSKPNTK